MLLKVIKIDLIYLSIYIMSSNSGISDGDFDRLLISTDLAVGQDQDFGTSGAVLTSAGEGSSLFWGTNSATLPEKLIKGDNILFKNPSGTEVPDYNGSVATTITLESEVDIDELKTDKISLPKTGTATIELDGSTGIIETTSVGEVLSIKNGGDIKLYSDSGGSNTLFIDGNNGTITMGSQGKLQTNGVDEIMRVNNGGVINLYDDNLGASKTIELDGEEGSIIGKTLILNGKSGTTTGVFAGNVNINVSPSQDGDLTVAGDYSSLNGNLTLTNGTITCDDLVVNNHTGIIELSQIRTSFIGLPKTGTLTFSLNSDSMNLTDYSVNGATSTATFKVLTLMGGSGVADSLVILGNTLTGTDSDGTDGTITIGSGDLKVNNGGNVDLFSDAGTTQTIEIDGSNGTITADGLISGGSLTTAGNITATGTGPGYIGVGTDGDSYKILLEKDGTITCDDLVVDNHTGEITFNDLVCNDLECKTFEILNPSGGGFTFQLTNNIMSFSGAYTISGASANATLKSLILSGGNAGVDTCVIAGSTDTATDTAGNLGSITLNTGDLTASTGNIIATAGSLTSNRIGSKPAPINGTYTEWGLNLSDTNTHGYIGGNLIVNGKIFGDVEGSITEEEIDCQRITCRTASPTIGGITGMILGTGAVISNDTTGIYELTIDADDSSILCNNLSLSNNTSGDQALSVLGNVTLSSGSTRTTTIGNVGNSGQTLEVLCNNVNLGETAGNQQNNILNYRGGVHTFTGEKINIGSRLGFTNVGCSIEGTMGQGADNIYRNNVKFLNLDGQYLSHTLAGTIQNFVILRSATERTIQVAMRSGFIN